MSKELREKFESELEQADWSMLDQHAQRGAFYLVDQGLDLFDAAVSLAEDNVNKVKQWLEQQQLRKPTQEEIEEWKRDPHQKIIKFLIVQPYVLGKKIDES